MAKVKINGALYDRIPCGNDDFLEYNKDGKPCKDCGAAVGEYHSQYCEAEMCPARSVCDLAVSCGGQLCACEKQPEYI